MRLVTRVLLVCYHMQDLAMEAMSAALELAAALLHRTQPYQMPFWQR
jgi:hypothetical protein